MKWRALVIAGILFTMFALFVPCSSPTTPRVAHRGKQRSATIAVPRIAVPKLAARWSPSRRASVRGVVETTLGRPIAGALVTMSADDDVELGQVTTGDDGRYAFAFGIVGQLVVTAAGHASQRKPFDSARREINFQLTAGGSIRGRVVGEGERPCPDPEVHVDTFSSLDGIRPAHWHDRQVTGDRDGRFVVDGLPPGELRITARGIGCITRIATDVDLALGQHIDGVRVIAERGFTIAGTAVRRGTTAAVAGVSVTLGHGRAPTATTDRDGRFLFHGIAADTYDIQIAGNAVKRELANALVVDRDRDDVHVEVDVGRTIRGRVEPARVANLVAPEHENGTSILDQETTSAADGRFALHNVPDGQTLVRAYTDDGYEKDVVVPARGDVSDLVVALAPSGNATRSAHVVDEDGTPIAFARVWIVISGGSSVFTQSRELTADGSGAIHVSRLPAGRVLAWLTDHVMASDAVELPEGRDQAIVARGRAVTHALRGTVRDASGAPVANIRMRSGVRFGADGVDPFTRGGETLTNADGRFEITGLIEGDYHLHAESSTRDRVATVVARTDKPIVITLEARHHVELRVTANGVRVHDFHSRCTYGTDQVLSTRSSGLHDGRLKSLEPGPITCHVTTETGVAVATGVVGQTPVLDLPLSPGFRIVGRIVDAKTGAPAANSTSSIVYRDARDFYTFGSIDHRGYFEVTTILPGTGELWRDDRLLETITVHGDHDVGTLRR